MLFSFCKMFIYSLFDLQTVYLNCLTISWKQEKFLKNLQCKKRVKFPGTFHWLLFQAIADIQYYVISIANICRLMYFGICSGCCTAETSRSTWNNEAALISSGIRSGWRFRKASISFCVSLNGSSLPAIAACWFATKIQALQKNLQ